jgi:hypothetical protein
MNLRSSCCIALLLFLIAIDLARAASDQLGQTMEALLRSIEPGHSTCLYGPLPADAQVMRFLAEAKLGHLQRSGIRLIEVLFS